MIRGSVLVLWIYVGWGLFVAGTLLFWGQCGLHGGNDSLMLVAVLGFFGLWALQVIATIWLGVYLHNFVWTAVCALLLWHPLLGAIGIGVMFADARRRLLEVGLSVGLAGVSPAAWQHFLESCDSSRNLLRCPNCGERQPDGEPMSGEPPDGLQWVCPMCGHQVEIPILPHEPATPTSSTPNSVADSSAEQ